MSLLSADGVSKYYRRGRREFLALDNASFTVEPAELVVVLGTHKSGRSTLLRLAAGLERPDSGSIRFEGRELHRSRDIVGRRIAYCHTSFQALAGERVLDHVAVPLLATGLARRRARQAAEAILERTGALRSAPLQPDELNAAERVRVALARALGPSPRMVVMDDVSAAGPPIQADGLHQLLRSFTVQERCSVLMSSDDATWVSGADRIISIDAGKLRSETLPPHGEVLPLRPRRTLAEPLG